MASSSITLINGDLFSSSTSLAHCVSQDLRMGRGIAVKFLEKFGGREELRSQNLEVGTVGVLESEGRYIYYLITKSRYFDKPTLETLRSSLIMMRDHAIQHSVPTISMPRIGCGLDRLRWEDVEQILREVFAATPISICVYML